MSLYIEKCNNCGRKIMSRLNSIFICPCGGIVDTISQRVESITKKEKPCLKE